MVVVMVVMMMVMVMMMMTTMMTMMMAESPYGKVAEYNDDATDVCIY